MCWVLENGNYSWGFCLHGQAAVVGVSWLRFPSAAGWNVRRTKGQGCGVHCCKKTESAREIMVNLNRGYGMSTPMEKAYTTVKWVNPWNPGDPIAIMFLGLEELYLRPHYGCGSTLCTPWNNYCTNPWIISNRRSSIWVSLWTRTQSTTRTKCGIISRHNLLRPMSYSLKVVSQPAQRSIKEMPPPSWKHEEHRAFNCTNEYGKTCHHIHTKRPP